MVWFLAAVISGCGADLKDRGETFQTVSGWHSVDSLRAGYAVLDSLEFTAHGRGFSVVILKNTEERADGPPWRWEGVRPLLLYSTADDGNQELEVRNDSVILCLTCGGIFGDPYEGIEFKEDTLIIHHYGGSNWRWATTHWFVNGLDGGWPLVRRRRVFYSVFEPDSPVEVDDGSPAVPVDLRNIVTYE